MTTGRPWRVYVLEDHPIMREGLVGVLEAQSDFAVVGDSGKAPADVGVLKKEHPDLLILDVKLTPPLADGLGVLKTVRVELPACKVVVFSGHAEYREKALERGAHAFVDKDEPSVALLATLRRVLRGEPPSDGGPYDPEAVARVMSLTAAEQKVGWCMAEGMDPAQAADYLQLSPHTVRDHQKSMYPKLGVHDGRNAVRVLIDGGIRTKKP